MASATAGDGDSAIHTSYSSMEELNRAIRSAQAGVQGSNKAVLGEGAIEAELALVGEQPGDKEDRQGRPFVGPAGQLLDRALSDAGIERGQTYLTNAVKHFKFVQRGKRRIHQRPTVGEVRHYRWWLAEEMRLVHPGVIVALGATAALALCGKAIGIERERGPATFFDRPGYITVHPSYVLRLPDPSDKKKAYDGLVRDLSNARKLAS